MKTKLLKRLRLKAKEEYNLKCANNYIVGSVVNTVTYKITTNSHYNAYVEEFESKEKAIKALHSIRRDYILNIVENSKLRKL